MASPVTTLWVQVCMASPVTRLASLARGSLFSRLPSAVSDSTGCFCLLFICVCAHAAGGSNGFRFFELDELRWACVNPLSFGSRQLAMVFATFVRFMTPFE